MAYPYVATTTLSLTIGGVLIGILLWFAIRLGW